ncbi:unnamed protein product [Cylicocyclus nassatus]|uniref:Uncharacterized protein n=1 Tax=Cylicocyclus nassatus TaxID=53992 RepID=A0AA36H1A1_CYLNA|nr:unnamed protein product [Cylicocyclus nassatus]
MKKSQCAFVTLTIGSSHEIQILSKFSFRSFDVILPLDEPKSPNSRLNASICSQLKLHQLVELGRVNEYTLIC